MSDRPYDIVFHGASGFVGQQAVRYFTQHARPDGVRWAIAGRNRQKLETVKQKFGADADILVADSQDRETVDAMVSQARVLLNAAGPFALYGNKIIDACVRLHSHYVDITGETFWVRDLIDRYHERAAARGTRIIPFCGFDSVPSDLGTLLVVRHFQQELGIPCSRVRAYFQLYGGLNGGTLASGFNLYDSGQAERASNPFLLNPLPEAPFEEVEQNRDPEFPHYDPDIGAWVAPFFMGPVNTRVVRRSCALFERQGQPYGTDFSYQEYLKFDPPLAWLQATGVTAATAIFYGAMRQSFLRPFLKSVLPRPGSGPSEKTMNDGWFCCELFGYGNEGNKVLLTLSDRGDPGNRATAKFLCESALSLALNEDRLPGGPQCGGILTPATGLGEVLVQRLQETGMKIKIKTI